MTNLLEETKQAMIDSGHTEADIVYIGSRYSGHQCSWEEFCDLADEEYNSGFGAQKVASDLVVAFRDGQRLERGEYDGSEGWVANELFKRPDVETKKIKRLICNEYPHIGWESLDELNKDLD